jgi:hypothetical protein
MVAGSFAEMTPWLRAAQTPAASVRLRHICDMPRCLTRVRNALKTIHRRELHTAVFKEVKLNRGRAMGFASQDS